MSDFFQADRLQAALVIQCPADFSYEALEELSNKSRTWLNTDASIVIFDFQNTAYLDNNAYRAFLQLAQMFKRTQRIFNSVQLNAFLVEQLTEDGVIDSFCPKKSTEEALQSAGLNKPKSRTINVAFVNPFINATLNTLKVQANTEATPGKPFLKGTTALAYEIGIVGVISLQSDQFQGSITLCFPAPVFLKIYENMLGEAHAEITREVQDAAGELLNIIFGTAKAALNNAHGYTIQKAIPTVLTGSELQIHQNSKEPVIILPFETTAGPMHLEILAEHK